LEQAIDNSLDQARVRELLEAKALAQDHLNTEKIMQVREEMERYNAQKLQPHYIKAFFMQAFEKYHGTIAEREKERFRIDYVPAQIRNHAKALHTALPVWEKYDRIAFSKDLIEQPGKPLADFITPGHPLLDTLIDLVRSDSSDLLQTGTILVDDTDPGDQMRLIYFVEQSIYDETGDDQRHVLSREVHFVQVGQDGGFTMASGAPYGDYRAPTPEEKAWIQELIQNVSLLTESREDQIIDYATENLIPRHLNSVKTRRDAHVKKTLAAVHERLTKEINYWDNRASELRKDVTQGKANAKLNLIRAQQRADDLHNRLRSRKEHLERSRRISARPPVIVGGFLLVPIGCLLTESQGPDLSQRRVTEQIAMRAVMDHETASGCFPKDVSQHNLGYDIESFDPQTHHLRFLEVKGRREGANTVTVSRNEILTGLNSGEQYYLVVVPVQDGQPGELYYLQNPFGQEPDYAVTSVTFNWQELLTRSSAE
jgi:hypothetical protein